MSLSIRLFRWVAALLFLYGGVVQAQTVQITSISPDPICAGSSTNVGYVNTLPIVTNNLTFVLNGPNTVNQVLVTTTVGPGASTFPVPIPADKAGGTYTLTIQDRFGALSAGRTFTIRAKPAPPGVANVTYCQNATGVPPLTATGQNLKWYTASTGGTGSTTAPTPLTSTVGATNYYVSQTINGCESDRATLTVTVNQLPAKPTVVSSLSYCQNATAPSLAAAVTSGSNLRWYTTATDGVGSTSAPTPNTASLTPVTYYVSQVGGNSCESERASITVSIRVNPNPPTVANPSVSYCQDQPATPLSATPAAGGTLNWFNPSGNALGSTAPTPSTNNPGTTPPYKVSQTVSGCTSTTVAITVTVNGKPAAPTTRPVNVCQGTTPVSLATGVTSGTNLRWYTTATGGTGSTVAPSPATTTVGPQTFYVSQINSSNCESDRAVITYTVNAYPTAPTVSPNSLTYCQNATAVPLTATPVTSATLTYYTVATGGTPYATLPPSTISTNNYYVSQTLNGCEGPRATIRVVINALPPKPTVTTPAPYCQFAPASPLSATALTNNTLSWYGTNAMGGTSSSTEPTPPNTAAGTFTYYVSQKDLIGCESERASITVTFNAKPTAPVTAPLSACLNSPAPSLPSSVTATGALRWYTAVSGGVGATVAPTLSTTATGTPTTYYVSQVSTEGCESDRTAITFTVNPLPVAPVPTPAKNPLIYCQNETAAQLTANGQRLKWYSVASGGSPLADPVIPSTTVAGPPVTYYVSQTDNNGCESPRASITVTTVSRPAAPTVSSPPVTYCQYATATPLSATPITGNSLNWYGTAATGGTASATPTRPTTDSAGTKFYYVSQTDGNGCESSSRASITVTVNPKPTAPTATSIALCQNATPVALATAVTSGINLKWYTTQTGGTGSTMAPTLSTAAVGSTTYYVSQTSAEGCESDRSAVLVTVKQLPAAPTITPNPQNLCQSSVPSPLTAIATGTLKWYNDLTSSQSYTSVTPLTTTVGPTTYYVSQTSADGCEGPKAALNVVVIPKPVAPTVTSSVTICQAATTPITLTATGQNLKWYTDPTGGTPSTVAPTPPNSASGTTTYYVTQTDLNGCESDRAAIAFRVKAKPASPVTTPVAFCSNAVSSLTATFAAGTSPNWYGTNATGGTASPTAPTPLTNVVGAPINYYVSQTLEGCESDRAAIAVTIKALPVAPTVSTTPVLYCQGATAQPLSATPATGGTLNWYTTQTGGTASPTSFTPSTTSSVPPTSYYYVSQTVNGCEGPRATIAVTINPKPTAPIVTPAVTYCQNATATPLTATASGTLRWYTDPAGSAAIPTPTPSTATPGVTNYYVTQTSSNGCESDRATIVVTINALPAAPVVSQTAITVCQNSTPVALTATASSGGTLNWYTTINGQPLSTAPAPPTTTAGSITTYYVSQTVSGCEGPKTAIAVTVTALPAAPAVTTPVAYCQNATAQPLSATPATGGTLNWYGPTGVALGSTTPTPSTTIAGPQTYAVSQSVNGCEGPKASITVNINQAPVAPTTTAALAYCQGSMAPALTATGTGTINWYTTAGGPASSVAPIPTTTTAGVQTYYVSQTVNGCESDKVTITVTIKATPVAPTPVNPTISLCQSGTAAALMAVPSTGGTLNWYTTVGGTASPMAPTPNTGIVGQQTYYVSQTVDGCTGPTASVVVTVNALPTAPLVANASVHFCQNSTSTSLTALASPGATLIWYSGTSGTGSPTAPVPPTNVAGPQTYYVSQSLNGCEGPRTLVTVTIDPLPAAPITSPTPITYCQGVTALPLTASGTGTLNWYTAAGAPPSQTAPIPSTTTPGLFTYYVSQTVNGCEGPQAPILVLINATPAAPTAGAAPIYCQNGTSIAPVAIPSSGGTLNWYTTATGGSPSSTPATPPAGATGTVTYYVSQSISGCEGPRIALTATIKPSPIAPTVTPTLAYCQNSVAPALTATPSGGTLTWYMEPTGGSGSPTLTPQTTTVGTQSYYVSQTVDGCEGPRAAVAVTVRALPAAPTTIPLSICQNGTPPSLALSVAATGPVNWYTAQTGGTPSTVPPVPVTTNAGPITYYVSQTDANGCESQRSLLLVTITPTPSAPVVPTLAPVCQNTAPVVLTAAGQGLKWYADATSTGSLGSSIVQQTGVAGTFGYYVSQTVGTCEGPRTLAQVVVNASPAAPVVQATQSGCQDAPAQPLTASGTALQWYDATDSQIGTPTPDTRVDATQTYTYKVTQTVNGCVSPAATVLYTVTALPVPTVTTPVVYCQGVTAQPLQASGSGLRWVDPNGAVTNVAPTPSTSVITAGASYSVSQTNAQGCESRKAEIRVTVNAQAVAVLSGTTTVSLGGAAPLTLTLSGVGPYSYTLSNGFIGVAESATVGTVTRTVSVTPTASTTYTLLGVSNGCGAGNASGSATVTVNVPSIVTGTLAVSTVCTGSTIDVPFTPSGTFTTGNTFVVEIAVAGDSATRQYRTISAGVVQGPVIQTTIPANYAQGLYFIRVRALNSNYPIVGTRSPTVLNVRSLPTASISANRSVVYKGERVQLLFTFSGDAPWSATYRDRTGTRTISSPTNPYSTTITADSSTTYKLLSVTNVCGEGRIDGVDSVRIRVDILTAEENPFAASVNVFPIPTNGDLTVVIDDPMLRNEAEIQLVRPNGQVAQTVKTRQRQTVLKLGDEPAGTYLLQIRLGDRSTVRRVLKQ